MEYCILCNKHLYQKISFQNLLKRDYYIHSDCLKLLNQDSFITFPFLDKIIEVFVLFPCDYKKANKELLFLYYGENYFKDIDDGFLYIILDTSITDKDLILLTKVSEKGIKFLTYTSDNIFDQ